MFHCVSSLTQNECFSLECEDSNLILIHIADLGGLKYPSDEVMDAVITLWKFLFRIERSSYHIRVGQLGVPVPNLCHQKSVIFVHRIR